MIQIHEEGRHFDAVSSGVRTLLGNAPGESLITDISTQETAALRVQFPSQGQDVTITQTGGYSDHFLEVRVTKDDVPQRTAYLNGGSLISHRMMETVAVELSALDIIFQQTIGEKKSRARLKTGNLSPEEHHVALLALRVQEDLARLGGFPKPGDYNRYQELSDDQRLRYKLVNERGVGLYMSVRSGPKESDDLVPDLLVRLEETGQMVTLKRDQIYPDRQVTKVMFVDEFRGSTKEMLLYGGELTNGVKRQEAAEVEAAAIATMLKQRGRWSAAQLAA